MQFPEGLCMDEDVPSAPDVTRSASDKPSETRAKLGSQLVRWGIVLLSGLLVLVIPTPEGIAPNSWRLLAIFVATITGSIVRPLPGGAIVLLGISAIALTGVLPVSDALSGYADPIVWLVLAAFFMSRGMIKTGLGRRIAFLFIRAIGRHSLGLGYALWNSLPRSEESGRSLRIEARGNGGEARSISDSAGLSM